MFGIGQSSSNEPLFFEALKFFLGGTEQLNPRGQDHTTDREYKGPVNML